MEMGRNRAIARGDHADLFTRHHAVSQPDLRQDMGMHGDNVPEGATITADKNGLSQEIIADGQDFTGQEAGNLYSFPEEMFFPRVIRPADHIHSLMGAASPLTPNPPLPTIQEIHTRQENDIFDGLPAFHIQAGKQSGIPINGQHGLNFHGNGQLSGKMNYFNFPQIMHHAEKMVKVIKKIKE